MSGFVIEINVFAFCTKSSKLGNWVEAIIPTVVASSKRSIADWTLK
jgi:hypothetical protein